MEKINLIIDIMETALLRNAREKNTIFVDYSGHVDVLTVQVFEKGWNLDCQEEDITFCKRIDLQKKNSISELKETLEYLENLK